MLGYRESRLTKIALGVFFVVVIGYALFEAQGIIFGPSITVTSETVQTSQSLISIKGHAERITSLLMNGKSIPVTEEGVFDEPYLLAPGLNPITLDATDRYGRSRRKIIQIVYTPPEGSAAQWAATTTIPAASSTTAEASTSLPMAQ